MKTATETWIPSPELEIGYVRYESGEARVRIKLGVLVKDIQPPTARAVAIALIHQAEMAQMPPDMEFPPMLGDEPDDDDDEGSGVPAM